MIKEILGKLSEPFRRGPSLAELDSINRGLEDQLELDSQEAQTLALNGSELSIKPRASRRFRIRRLKRVEGLPKFGNLFASYIDAINVPDYLERMFVNMFTKFSYPDTFFLVAFNEDREAIGFLWAEKRSDHMMVVEIFSEEASAGKLMFDRLIKHAKDIKLQKIKGLSSPPRANAIARLFDAEVTAYLLEREL